jgi:hypothetical protein
MVLHSYPAAVHIQVCGVIKVHESRHEAVLPEAAKASAHVFPQPRWPARDSKGPRHATLTKNQKQMASNHARLPPSLRPQNTV